MDPLKEWAQTWQRAGAELEKIRRQDIRNADTQAAILLFAEVFDSVLAGMPVRTSSGLVEQQKMFRRLRT